MEDITRYYMIDWLAMALSLLGVYLLGNKKKSGFVIFAISNLIWAGLGFTIMHSLGVAIGNLVFFVINTRGYMRWVREGSAAKADRIQT
jgi:nicotinamide riboside transporter PnuC